MIRLKAKELIRMQMALIMKVNGSTTSNMGTEWNHGQMVHVMKEYTKKVKKRETVV